MMSASGTSAKAYEAQIARALENVPALPSALQQLDTMLRDPDADLSQIIPLIEADPGLTANVLRFANSVALRGASQIGTIREAMVRLGMKKVHDLAMLGFMDGIGRDPVRGYMIQPGHMVEHSIMVARGAEVLASAWGEQKPDYLYTAGLLVDVGKIVLGNFVQIDAEPILELAQRLKIPFVEAERQWIGMDHAEVGAALLERWGLPAEIVNVARWHHEPERSDTPSVALDAVHIADVITMQCGIGVGRLEGLFYRVSRDVLARRPISQVESERIAAEMLVSLQTAMEQLNAVSAGGSA